MPGSSLQTRPAYDASWNFLPRSGPNGPVSARQSTYSSPLLWCCSVRFLITAEAGDPFKQSKSHRGAGFVPTILGLHRIEQPLQQLFLDPPLQGDQQCDVIPLLLFDPLEQCNEFVDIGELVHAVH